VISDHALMNDHDYGWKKAAIIISVAIAALALFLWWGFRIARKARTGSGKSELQGFFASLRMTA
jgi:hypothetical protein